MISAGESSLPRLQRNHYLPQALLIKRDSRRHGIAKHGDWPQSRAFQHGRKLGVAVQPDAIAGMPRIHTLAGMDKAIIDQQCGAAWVEARLAQHIAVGD